MKKLFGLLLLTMLFSCKENKNEKNKNDKPQEKEILTELYGSWVGGFIVKERDTTKELTEMYSNKINIVIKKITESEVIGQNIVAGNERPLKGKMIQNGNIIHFVLNEPGDDKNDGVFDFEIKNNVLKGTWIANNKNKNVTERSFELTKKKFIYNPAAMLSEGDMYVDFVNPKKQKIKFEDEENNEEYIENTYRMASPSVYTINSSKQKLKESDVKNLKKLDLEILRNTIFARHGLTFKTKTIRQFFDRVDWYIPISENVNSELTMVEKENIALLKRFEKYAEDNYDTFGR
ncbi:YARHG domain-containing protein [Flavobacterium resistens]|uniref:YARHG domain-containing protein n=1 Tax=Flavobacterium resistens TaxID=443612 RepID=A0A521DWY7_9FLAO|nr:YARHG domain-containing protein [Flavobacterium resistens]MRX68143.1 YARHG domain-containing protein [Flavobacterium resistens]SMO75380.1 YARHG domain-containing protein [Flavobacterium resistens]